jgi:hypothetical protein
LDMGRAKRHRDMLQEIPGIGPNLAHHIREIGFTDPSELRDQDPEWMYERLCEIQGRSLDKCVLYAFRCAVYYASHEVHDPELLKWWNWKDRAL